MVVHNSPSESGVENLLHIGLAAKPSSKIGEVMGIVRGRMMREVAQCGLAFRIEPFFYAREVPASGRVWQVVGHRPDPQERRKQMALRISKGEVDPRWRTHRTVKQRGIEIQKTGNESFVIVQHGLLDHSGLEFHVSVPQHPRFSPQYVDKR